MTRQYNFSKYSHVSSGLTTASIGLGVLAILSAAFTGGGSLAAYAGYMAATAGVVAGGIGIRSAYAEKNAGIQGWKKDLGMAWGQTALMLATMGVAAAAGSEAVSVTSSYYNTLRGYSRPVGQIASKLLGVAGVGSAIYGLVQEKNVHLGKGHAWERLDLFNAIAGGVFGLHQIGTGITPFSMEEKMAVRQKINNMMDDSSSGSESSGSSEASEASTATPTPTWKDYYQYRVAIPNREMYTNIEQQELPDPSRVFGTVREHGIRSQQLTRLLHPFQGVITTPEYFLEIDRGPFRFNMKTSTAINVGLNSAALTGTMLSYTNSHVGEQQPTDSSSSETDSNQWTATPGVASVM